MADLVMVARQAPALSWGANRDLAQRGTTRADYIAAMQKADRGDIGPLVKFAAS